MPALLDTHVGAWWLTADRRLSRRASTLITNRLAETDLWISLISVWDVGQLRAALDTNAWRGIPPHAV
jgi:PIN domain nuclease of toxin-antitoxin system